MADPIRIGDRVTVYLGPEFWRSEGWFEGTVVRIDPYSRHRQFYWVELDVEAEAFQGERHAWYRYLIQEICEKLRNPPLDFGFASVILNATIFILFVSLLEVLWNAI